MQPICATTQIQDQPTQPTQPSFPSQGTPPCPACMGRLVFMRNFYRCSRCGFCICIGCDDLPGAGMAGNEDA
jgi:hypothetical protein